MSKSGNQLEVVAQSYDKSFDLRGMGIDPYKELPDYITKDPDYHYWKTELDSGSEGSGRNEIKNYLLPKSNMKFIDLGCCLNLMFRGYDQWPSKYYGVDISSKTIELLNEFITKNKLPIGSLYCGSIHETPFEANFFDIGACIGVLEYYHKDYVEQALIEARRILKPDGKLVLDIPNIESPSGRMMMKIEEYMGGPDKFDMMPQEFEDMLKNYFDIEETDWSNTGAMEFRYNLRCKK